MNQQLDLQDWPSIQFDGEALPQSVSGISILMDRDLSAQARDWAWRFPICKEVWKEGDAVWCRTSASEIIDHLLEYPSEVIADIRDRLGPHGFDGPLTINEWISALDRVRTLAASVEGKCRWIAGDPTDRAKVMKCRLLAYTDKIDPDAP